MPQRKVGKRKRLKPLLLSGARSLHRVVVHLESVFVHLHTPVTRASFFRRRCAPNVFPDLVCVEECRAVEEVEGVKIESLFHVLGSSRGRGKDCTAFPPIPGRLHLCRILGRGVAIARHPAARFAKTSAGMSLQKMLVTHMKNGISRTLHGQGLEITQ